MLLPAVIKTKSSLTSNAVIVFSVRGQPRRPRSQLAGFGLRMMGQPRKLEKPPVFRNLAHAIGLLAGLVPALAHAQTNIDQGKSPAEIFANDCATCHKSARGLANGRGSSGLAGFLIEHYTASKDQAAALAAYVMGAGGGEAAPATQQGRGAKPAAQPTRAAVEEPKPEGRPARETARPGEEPPASARLQPPSGEEKRPGDVPSIMQEPGGKPTAAGKGRRKEPASAAPAAVVTAPATTGPAGQDTSPATVPGTTAGGPASGVSGDGEPVPRDNIPD
jgi:mono/diheme cytochrome c family protein